ncbi:hypothetical protein LNAOJCKE_4906 [Methylorubrum aminovorans]|uniref:Uncharacterized protein n=1 Tax=Methylorubrum aminovorans TaxID=269069 RepID=A0ABQ4UK96_9HYPH|nr:hypothetical protein [Methylorubrum aminovorans]GJE67674.1 hypothetical protein LNAOJCKE_4906 [Methylorubrum aminovorans]GMA79980.1 hypothetical protein GCM10025880_63970 [Methylorubrum aminovorans]
MAIPDLGSMLVSLSEVFPLIVNLIFLVIAVLGIWFGTSGLYALYSVAAGEHKFSNRPVTIDTAFGKLVLASAMIVAPVLLWKFANSFVLGGDITYNMFNYGSSARGSTCDQIRTAITYFFMSLGALAWLMAGLKLYKATSGHHEGAGSAFLYLVGGTLSFFINDVAQLVGTTIHMDVSLSNVCTMIGG